MAAGPRRRAPSSPRLRPDASAFGLVGYWSFDAGGGQIVGDGSPFEYHGELGANPGPDRSDPTWIVSQAPLAW
jgi:hypothetical protein